MVEMPNTHDGEAIITELPKKTQCTNAGIPPERLMLCLMILL